MRKTVREKIIIILGALVVASLLAYEYGYTPLAEQYGQMGEEIHISQLRQGKSRLKIEEKPMLENKIHQLNDRLKNFDQSLLPGQKPALAAASLQKIVKTIISRSRAAVTSEKIQQPVDVGQYTRIPVQVSLRCLVSELGEILYQIENYKVGLTVTEMTVRVMNPRDPSEVETSLIVEGMILAPKETDDVL